MKIQQLESASSQRREIVQLQNRIQQLEQHVMALEAILTEKGDPLPTAGALRVPHLSKAHSFRACPVSRP